MKTTASLLVASALLEAVHGVPFSHPKATVFGDVVEAASFHLPRSLHARQLQIPQGGAPPAPPASLPFSFGLSNTTVAPLSTGGSSWRDAHQRASAVVAQMTNEEKLGFVTGQNGRCAGNTLAIPRLNLSSLCFLDGPTGPRYATGVTQFPSGLTTAATWDRDLMYNRSHEMGREFYNLGVNVALAPVTGGPLGRSPLGGRNWEGWSPDPYLTGEAAYLSVKGVQDAGVAATSKHYIGYEQETYRNVYGSSTRQSGYGINQQLPISSNIDDKTNHELYLWPFAEAVRAGSAYIMSGYQLLNRTHVSANSDALNGHLKTELGFQGAVMSDWGGCWDAENTFNAGNDLDFPGLNLFGLLGSFFAEDLPAAFGNGTVTSDRLNDAVVRILTPIYQLGQIDQPLPPAVVSFLNLPGFEAIYKNVQTTESVRVAQKIAEDGMVLLKNTGVLPLNDTQTQRIALLGQDAGPNELGSLGCGSTGDGCPAWNNNGTYSMGGGSGWSAPNNFIDPVSAIRSRVLSSTSQIQQVLNNNATSQMTSVASSVDVSIVFVHAYSAEGLDRVDLNFSASGRAVIDATLAGCNNTILVLLNPGAVDLVDYVNNPNVTAIVAAGLPGEATGPALARVLFGDVSPSGKLPFTMGRAVSDYGEGLLVPLVANSSLAPQTDFTEGVFIDYRHFDRQGIEPLYEFGFGLSYSNFTYSDIALERRNESDTTSIQMTNEKYVGQTNGSSIYDTIAQITVNVKNSGSVQASEVAQLYITFPEGENQPSLQLRGFDKVKNLAAGASGTASFPIRRKDVMVWDVVMQMWRAPTNGTVTFSAGASSRMLPLQVAFDL